MSAGEAAILRWTSILSATGLILAASPGLWVRYDNGADVSDDGRMRRLLVLFGIVAAVGLGAPAQADPGNADASVDASFLDALTKAGITFSNGPSAVNAGKAACGLMKQGQPELDVIQHVSEQNPGISTTSAAKFTAIAASAYCPQYLQHASDTGGQSTAPPPSHEEHSGARRE
jgi:hypothetical protein